MARLNYLELPARDVASARSFYERVFGWAFTVWGVGLYWWAGILYAIQVRRLLATTPRVR